MILSLEAFFGLLVKTEKSVLSMTEILKEAEGSEQDLRENS